MGVWADDAGRGEGAMPTDPIHEVVPHLRRIVLRDGAGLTDGQLLESFVRRRDAAALEALVRRHGPMVWGVCRRVLGAGPDAEDAFQATFLVLLRRAASVVPPERVAAWLHGVAHRTAHKARAAAARRRQRERQVVELPEPAAARPDAGPDLRDWLDRELSRLPEPYRAALVACDLEGRTRKEAARQLGWPEGTVASRLVRARALLAQRLTRLGLPAGGAALAGVLAPPAAAGVPVAAALRAVRLWAAGHAVARAMIPARVVALAGVHDTMLLTKLKSVIVLAGVLGLLATGLSAYRGFAQQRTAEGTKPPVAQRPPAEAAPPADRPSDPRYCWLVFGSEARLRRLLRVDGREVAIDRDGDGKFDGKDERFASEKDCKGVVIAGPDGQTSYVITHVEDMHVVPPEKFLEVRVHVLGPLAFPQGAVVQLTGKPDGAPEAHFHGPLTVAPRACRITNRASRLVENPLVDLRPLLPEFLTRLSGKQLFEESLLPRSLKRTGEPTELSALVITEGANSLVAVCSPEDTQEGRREKGPFPKGVYPVVDVEFPAKRPGDPPIKRRYPLDRHSGEGFYRGPVRVPDEAGGGSARVTFSFDAWKGAKVAPTTVEVPVDDPPTAAGGPG